MISDIIIIEGVKKVGKTSLANDIIKKFDINYFKEEEVYNMIKSNVYNNSSITSYCEGSLKTIVSLLEKGLIKTPILIDRFHFSEYGFSFYRDMDAIEMFVIDYRLSNLDTKIIYLDDKVENIKTRTNVKFEEAKTRMDMFYSRSICTKLKDNYKDGYTKKIENFILKGSV